MNSEEVTEFEQLPNRREIIKVRYYDDSGKRADMATNQFAHYAPMIQRVVDAHCVARSH
jgi:predicted HD phosphohydrolase